MRAESMTNFVLNPFVRAALLVLLATVGSGVYAASPNDLLQDYGAQARKEDPAFKEFSVGAGEKFYQASVRHSSGRQVSCATCHTDNPRNAGKHEKTGKEIAPLAPSMNKARLADSVNVEKWFKRNCQDVLERACTAREKGNFIAYILSVK
jgi:mono/diheme cytochrome c family protein